MKEASWPVLPHGALEKLADGLWLVKGDIPWMPLKRVMVVARLASGGLIVHGAIAMRPEAMKELEALGEPEVLLVPSAHHRLDAPRYAERYPRMKVFCPGGAVDRVAKVVRVDGTYEDVPADPSVRTLLVDGIGDEEGVMEIGSPDGMTLVFNDILFNMPHRGWFTRAIGSSGGPRVSKTARFFLMRDARALARRFVALAATPRLVRVLVAHEDPITTDPGGVLRNVALTL